MTLSQTDWLRILNPALTANLGCVSHALFDFDGTISTLCQGWESVMEDVMLELICAGKTPPADLAHEVQEYINRSTGKMTILQMQWLADKVRSSGSGQNALSAVEYKEMYMARLSVSVSGRLEALQNGAVPARDYLIRGVNDFICGLAEQGVRLSIASGSDQADVVRQVKALGLAGYFEDRIYGAGATGELNGKGHVIRRILDDNHLAGNNLLVVGDGPVEMIGARQSGAISLGVASDEVACEGWNKYKMERLAVAGADVVVADFIHSTELIQFFVTSQQKGV